MVYFNVATFFIQSGFRNVMSCNKFVFRSIAHQCPEKKCFNFGSFLYNVQWVSSPESLSVETIFASFELDEI